jgi:hypothetical protein
MSQGLDGEEAIKRYQERYVKAAGDQLNAEQNNSNNNQTPPVVMGGDGNSGSGLAQNPVNFSNMKPGEFNDAVFNMLQADQQNNNQG